MKAENKLGYFQKRQEGYKEKSFDEKLIPNNDVRFDSCRTTKKKSTVCLHIKAKISAFEIQAHCNH